MKDKAEEKVSRFYNTLGWEVKGGVTEDAKRWEDLRTCAREYVSKCRLRVLKYIPKNGVNMLDMASGPIQYDEYLEYSKNFKKRYCVDLSSDALEQAKNKIGEHGVFLHGSFFELPLEKNFFDCAISLHTIYHMDKNKQEDAVRKLVDVVKPGKPVVIVYSNPNSLVYFLKLLIPLGLMRRITNSIFRYKKDSKYAGQSSLYFYPHPIKWWNKFDDIADVKVQPWRSFSADFQKIIIPDNIIGKKVFDSLFYLEGLFPNVFARFCQYPMIILTKKEK